MFSLFSLLKNILQSVYELVFIYRQPIFRINTELPGLNGSGGLDMDNLLEKLKVLVLQCEIQQKKNKKGSRLWRSMRREEGKVMREKE